MRDWDCTRMGGPARRSPGPEPQFTRVSFCKELWNRPNLTHLGGSGSRNQPLLPCLGVNRLENNSWEPGNENPIRRSDCELGGS